MTHLTIGTFSARLMYSLDLRKMLRKMPRERRRKLAQDSMLNDREPLDTLAGQVEAEILAACREDGDPAPTFERRGELLLVTEGGGDAA